MSRTRHGGERFGRRESPRPDFGPTKISEYNHLTPSRPSRATTGDVAALVMAKAPRPGYAKTRLEPVLGAGRCADLQAVMTRHALSWASSVAPQAAFAAFAPADAGSEIGALSPGGVRIFPQVGGGLGDRLMAATQGVFTEHRGPLLVVGTDCPTLRRRHAHVALEALAGGADVCFGPAVDGGYYLVAMRRASPDIFRLPAEMWGGPAVLEESVRRARRAGLEVAQIDPERDLDDVRDARAVVSDPRTPEDIVGILTAAIARHQ
jgi:uncharacterized protein